MLTLLTLLFITFGFQQTHAMYAETDVIEVPEPQTRQRSTSNLDIKVYTPQRGRSQSNPATPSAKANEPSRSHRSMITEFFDEQPAAAFANKLEAEEQQQVGVAYGQNFPVRRGTVTRVAKKQKPIMFTIKNKDKPTSCCVVQ